MGHELVCSWLGLPADRWPPDHYTLLGLEPGEGDVHRIEEHVHARLLRLRPYQLNHPDQVTEAMNRLARAFTCLTNPETKRVYDTVLFGRLPGEEMPPPEDPVGDVVDPLAWMFGPWSQLAAHEPAGPHLQILDDWRTQPPPPRVPISQDVSEAAGGNGAVEAAPATSEASPPAPPPVDPMVEAAWRSSAARRGLATRRGLYRRIQVTRRLLGSWEAAGKYLNHPQWRPTRPGAADLIRQLHRIGDLLDEFPPLLGEAGQPGFWVASLARQEVVIPIFRALVPSQRQTLARDWRNGQLLLRAHYEFLRNEVRRFRHRTRWDRTRLAIHLFVQEHPSVKVGSWALLAVLAFLLVYVLAELWLALFN